MLYLIPAMWPALRPLRRRYRAGLTRSRGLRGPGAGPGTVFRLRGRLGFPWGTVRGSGVPVVRPGGSVP